MGCAGFLHARARGMNRFNILNIVPPPKDPKALWVCYTPPAATEDPAFYPAFKARLDPYVAELRRHGLQKFAYLYGFDERQKEYYKGIDDLWRKLRADFPDTRIFSSIYPQKTRVCLLYCFVLSPLTLLGAVPTTSL